MAIWFEYYVSWKFGKLPNIGFESSWCLIASVGESGWEFPSGRKFSMDARPHECSTLDVFGLVVSGKTMVNG